MSRASSASDGSRLSGGARQRDCQLGQLHTAYFGLCKKVHAVAALEQLSSRCLHAQHIARMDSFACNAMPLSPKEAEDVLG